MQEPDRKYNFSDKLGDSSQLSRHLKIYRKLDNSNIIEPLDSAELIEYWGHDFVNYRDVASNTLSNLAIEMGTDFLINLLAQYRISTNSWNKGSAKTPHHLYDELISRESILLESINGEILRLVRAVGINIFYRNYKGELYRLVEDEQIFNDSRRRNRTLNSSIAEKVLSQENAEEAARRAVREELNILGDLHISPDKIIEETRISSSYPGLPSKYKYYLYTLYLCADQYRPDGYVEVQVDKKTYFKWQGFNH